MKYEARSFSVAMGEGSGAMCREKGHSATDARGRCLCCGAHVADSREWPTALLDVVVKSFDSSHGRSPMSAY